MQCLGSMIHLAQKEQIAMEGQTSEAKPTNEKRRTRLQDGEWRVEGTTMRPAAAASWIHYGRWLFAISLGVQSLHTRGLRST
jgi:hypothetical protein